MNVEGGEWQIEELDSISLPLVNRFYKSCRYSAKGGRGERVYVLRKSRSILAALRLTPKPENYYFLRSMCVHPNNRGQGLGARLLAGVVPTLDQHRCFCFPFSHLLDFYGRVGFRHCEPSAVPAFVRDPFRRYRQQGRDIVIMVRDPAEPR